jgi:hypothetical protein
MANQKEIQTIRQALRLIASGETLDARRMLAGLTMTGRPAATKTVKSTKQKSQPGYWNGHKEHGIKLAKVTVTTRENKETGEIETGRRLGRSVVFCRHQVEVQS